MEVHHDIFVLPKNLQGKGISKDLFRDLYERYKRLGVRYVSVDANIDVGGYVWSKYGFYARNRDSIYDLIYTHDNLPPSLADKIESAASEWYENGKHENAEPFPMKIISDKPWGKKALIGSFWEGILDFNNKEQTDIFERYLGIR